MRGINIQVRYNAWRCHLSVDKAHCMTVASSATTLALFSLSLSLSHFECTLRSLVLSIDDILRRDRDTITYQPITKHKVPEDNPTVYNLSLLRIVFRLRFDFGSIDKVLSLLPSYVPRYILLFAYSLLSDLTDEDKTSSDKASCNVEDNIVQMTIMRIGQTIIIYFRKFLSRELISARERVRIEGARSCRTSNSRA